MDGLKLTPEQEQEAEVIADILMGAMQVEAKKKLDRLNAVPSWDMPNRTAMFRDQLGSFGDSFVLSPVTWEYGKHIHIGEGVFINFECVFLDGAEVRIGALLHAEIPTFAVPEVHQLLHQDPVVLPGNARSRSVRKALPVGAVARGTLGKEHGAALGVGNRAQRGLMFRARGRCGIRDERQQCREANQARKSELHTRPMSR